MAGSLENKVAVIFGGGGSLGEAVAHAFAREGARTFVTGRSAASINKVAADINSSGGFAEAEVVDAVNEKAVADFVEALAKREGHIDISFNAIAFYPVQGTPLIEMTLEDFANPINLAMQLCFVTAKAIGGQMKKQGSGVILSLTATPAGKAYALVGGFGPACNAIEGFTRNLASELGPYGVRVACIRSAGSPDSRFFLEELANNPEAAFGVKQLENDTMLGRLPLMADIANVAAFLASDRASGMTGTTVNVTCGTTMD